MMSKDTELDALGERRNQTRTTRDHAKGLHDEWFEYARSLHGQHDARVAWLENEGDALYGRMGDAFHRSKECYASGDHGGAGYWSVQGKTMKAQLSEINGEKTCLISELKEADRNFEQARACYLEAKATHDAAQRAFNERLETVRRQKAAKAAARARRLAAKKPSIADEAIQAEIEKARKKFSQFRDTEIRVTVQQGFDSDYQTSVINVYIYHRDPAIGEHVHAIFREDTGEELMCEYHTDD